MHSRTQDLLAHSWQSQANLSFFLSLLILLGFVLEGARVYCVGVEGRENESIEPTEARGRGFVGSG